MKVLKERIVKDGKIREGNVLKVDSFLNHQLDINLFEQIGEEFKRRFAGEKVTKILTIEASGIAIACIAARHFNVPVVFAKKTQTKNIAGDVYTSKVESFTHGKVYDIIVSKEFLKPEDHILIIDDFLANGKALLGLSQLVKDAGATLVGAGIVIEKGFQVGGEMIRESGVRLESLAIIDEMSVEEKGKYYVNGHMMEYDQNRKANIPVPVTIVIPVPDDDEKGKKKAEAFKHKFMVDDDTYKEYGAIVNMLNGAQKTEITEDMLTDEQREDLDLGIITMDDIRAEIGGNVYGDRIREYQLVKPARGFTKGRQDTVWTDEDMVIKAIEETVPDSEDLFDEEAVDDDDIL